MELEVDGTVGTRRTAEITPTSDVRTSRTRAILIISMALHLVGRISDPLNS